MYARLVAFLDEHGVQYRLIDHAPEGRTEIVSPMRGNMLSQAAKCIVLMVKMGKKITRYILVFQHFETTVLVETNGFHDGCICGDHAFYSFHRARE